MAVDGSGSQTPATVNAPGSQTPATVNAPGSQTPATVNAPGSQTPATTATQVRLEINHEKGGAFQGEGRGGVHFFEGTVTKGGGAKVTLMSRANQTSGPRCSTYVGHPMSVARCQYSSRQS